MTAFGPASLNFWMALLGDDPVDHGADSRRDQSTASPERFWPY